MSGSPVRLPASPAAGSWAGLSSPVSGPAPHLAGSLRAGPFPASRPSYSLSLRYYEPVRPPTSAQASTPVLPCASPPAATMPLDPVGSPGFRKQPFVREVVQDPGEASPSRVAMAHMLPSRRISRSAFTMSWISGLNTHSPHDPCLRFVPYVAGRHARLGPGPRATALAGRDFRPQVAYSFAQRSILNILPILTSCECLWFVTRISQDRFRLCTLLCRRPLVHGGRGSRATGLGCGWWPGC